MSIQTVLTAPNNTKEFFSMSNVPSFIKAGQAGNDIASGGGKFLKLESGKPREIIPLTGVEPPDGEEPNGSNSIISFNQYAIWKDNLPDGVRSPVFPAIGGKSDPGAMLGLEPRFKGFMLVIEKGGEDELVWPFTVSVFKQLCELESTLGESIKGMILKVSRTGEGLKTKYRVVATGKRVAINGEPETDLMEHVGPTTREEIVEMLEAAGEWPPVGGDPFAKPKTTGGVDFKKLGDKKKIKDTDPNTKGVQPVPQTTDDEDDDFEMEDDE
jgi:hypothetical protein